MAYLVELTCGHSVEVKAPYDRAGMEERCPVHGAWMQVVRYSRDQWHMRCIDCRASSSHGQAKVYAERAAKLHQFRYPSHRPTVQYYNRGKAKLSPADIVSSVPTLFDAAETDYGPPPF